MFGKLPEEITYQQPTLVGKFGKAWDIDLARIRREVLKVPQDDDAALIASIVEAPWAHGAWHSYMFSLVHLRPMADNRPTIFYLEGATHELVIEAINPDYDRNEMLKTGKVYRLTPANFAEQFIAESDEAAIARVKDAIMLVVDGKLSPDTDYIRAWANLFGDNMIKKEYR